jgi:hypothetical protein
MRDNDNEFNRLSNLKVLKFFLKVKFLKNN